jgi:serine protease Do
MTVGVISALGRSLPANDANSAAGGPTYTIPDIIQTDAPINPGNSGGVLLDDQSQVVGVTAAIESSSQASAGIGFVIPAAIVNRVVPTLITNGSYQHPYLGVTLLTVDADINKAMNLPVGQQGALVVAVTVGAPAEKAGLQPSTKTVTINGQSASVGGDVIIAINGQPVKTMEDLIAYLEANVTVGQKVTLTVLRGGNKVSLDVTTAARPNQPVTSIFPTSAGYDSNAVLLGFPVSATTPVNQ